MCSGGWSAGKLLLQPSEPVDALLGLSFPCPGGAAGAGNALDLTQVRTRGLVIPSARALVRSGDGFLCALELGLSRDVNLGCMVGLGEAGFGGILVLSRPLDLLRKP